MNFLPLLQHHATTWEAFREVREFTDWIVAPLEPEDCVIQSMPEASPTRWHLAHTTWFFETFLLAQAASDYQPVAPEYEYLFNSYYNTVGEQFPRPLRGMLSRPTVAEVCDYRRVVERRLRRLLDSSGEGGLSPEQLAVLELGLQHEQQHQELMLTDIKHVFSCNPLGPVYREQPGEHFDNALADFQWMEQPGGVVEVGHNGSGFCFDNELPRFETLLAPYQIANRPVTCGEYVEFIESGGYEEPDHWLSLGWSELQQQGWQAPLYWRQDAQGKWSHFTLAGWQPLQFDAPLAHVSYFEADAYARWRGARLPHEYEWELACIAAIDSWPASDNFAGSGWLQPTPGEHWLGGVWEWTSSSYSAYPGYRPPPGALGEYNGKFMCNQYVLRGGSCVTPRRHIRPTYRNFFPPEARWQFSGLRLARDA